MNQKHTVTLTTEERVFLEELIAKGKTQGYRIRHAQILLKLAEIPENRKWTHADIQEAYGATPYTISQIAKRFVTQGMEATLGRKEQQNRHRKVDGTVETHMIAIACSEVDSRYKFVIFSVDSFERFLEVTFVLLSKIIHG